MFCGNDDEVYNQYYSVSQKNRTATINMT